MGKAGGYDPRKEAKQAGLFGGREDGGGGGGGGGGTITPPTPPGETPPPPIVSDGGEMKTALSALFQYLSPEDQKVQGMTYGLTPTNTEIPTEITGDIRNTYLNAERATNALASLDAMQGINKSGPGYAFLKNAIMLLKQYGGTASEGIGREKYSQFAKQFNDLIEAVKGNEQVAPYIPLAQMFLGPSFSAGSLMETQKVGSNEFFGAPNPKLYN